MKEIKIIESMDKKYPQKLLEIENYPKKLYALGNIELLNKNSVAIVGVRDCTQYGIKNSYSFANELAKNNICVVSGMAIGIDTSAHYGAIEEKGGTIAVLGCGFNNIYPKENESLFYKILNNNGCVISEYEPSTIANLSTFPHRNRIISGLSLGVLIVEAKGNGGTLVTANYARKQKRKLFCIPGNIDSKQSNGTNKLIKEGAKLVTNVEDIMKEIEIKTERSIEGKVIEEEYRSIYETITNVPINVNLITKKCNLGISEVTQKLLIMEIKGYIKSLPGNEYMRL